MIVLNVLHGDIPFFMVICTYCTSVVTWCQEISLASSGRNMTSSVECWSTKVVNS
jgi:hypothetical protein